MLRDYILEMNAITKEFPGVRALDNVSFKVGRGEIHALVGENGAGKSTLMKVLSGVYPYGSYAGDILIDGKIQQFNRIRDAEMAGISIIYQELSLAKNLSIAENLFMGDEPMKHFLIDWDEMYSKSNTLLKKVGIGMDSRILVRNLGIGHQQLVEIAKALRCKSKILVLDEPTSALTQSEVEILHHLLKALRDEGVTCIYISHRIEEVFKIADSVTVLRDGKTVDSKSIHELNEEAIIRLMVGRNLAERYPRKDHQRGELLFEVKNYSVRDSRDNKEKLRNINFKLFKGEILGIAGLMGAGRTELVNSLFGAYNGISNGEVYLKGAPIKISTPMDAIRHGIGLITEDRKNFGIIPTASIRENISVASLNKISGGLAISDTSERVMCQSFVSDLRIKLGSLENKITSLSGGNQQKVILARWLMTEPCLLILDEPTRGIDVGAKFEIYNIINDLVENGVGIIIISSELPEILGISDRVLVMRNGELAGELNQSEATQEIIMNYATGVS